MWLVAVGLWLVEIGVGLLGPVCGLLGYNRHGVGVLGPMWVVGWLVEISWASKLTKQRSKDRSDLHRFAMFQWLMAVATVGLMSVGVYVVEIGMGGGRGRWVLIG